MGSPKLEVWGGKCPREWKSGLIPPRSKGFGGINLPSSAGLGFYIPSSEDASKSGGPGDLVHQRWRSVGLNVRNSGGLGVKCPQGWIGG